MAQPNKETERNAEMFALLSEVCNRASEDPSILKKNKGVRALVRELYIDAFGEPSPSPWMIAGVARQMIQGGQGGPTNSNPKKETKTEQAQKKNPSKKKEARETKEQTETPVRKPKTRELFNLKGMGKRMNHSFPPEAFEANASFSQRILQAWRSYVEEGHNTFGLTEQKTPLGDLAFVADRDLYNKVIEWAESETFQPVHADGNFRPHASQRVRDLLEKPETSDAAEAAAEGKAST